MKNILKFLQLFFAALLILLIFAGCGTKVLVCDRCGREYKVPKSSNIEQDWINYCADCAEEMGLNDLIPEDK